MQHLRLKGLRTYRRTMPEATPQTISMFKPHSGVDNLLIVNRNSNTTLTQLKCLLCWSLKRLEAAATAAVHHISNNNVPRNFWSLFTCGPRGNMHAKRNSAIFHLCAAPFITETVRTLRFLPRGGRGNLKKSHLSRTVWKLIPLCFVLEMLVYIQKKVCICLIAEEGRREKVNFFSKQNIR